jgi:hypothetical protein
MKKISLVLLLVWSDFTFGQTTFVPVPIAFPHVVAGGDSGGQNYVTLLQVVNNNSASITGHLSLFGDTGSPLAVFFDGHGPQATLDISLVPGQTREIQVTLNGPVTSGWLEISYTPSDALTTVILQFRSGSTLLSEIGVAPSFGPLAATDLAAETNSTLNTGIAIANPDTATAYVLASLWDPVSGSATTQNILSLPPGGHMAKFLTDLFPTAANITQIRAKVSLDGCADPACSSPGGNGFFATAVRFSQDQFTTIPVADRPMDGDQIRILPQVAFGGPSGGLNMKTVLYLTTNVSSGVFGTIDIFDNDGNPLPASADGAAPATSIPVTVPGNRVVRIVLSGDETLRSGWIRLTLSSAVHLIANAVFQTFSGSDLVSEASVLESPQVMRGLIYVNSQPGAENIGVAFANSQPSSNTIQLELFDGTGTVVAQQQISLPPNGHLAQFVTELFPQIASGGFVGALSMHSTTSFSAIALRLTTDKIATLPIAIDGMYRPAITGLRVTGTQRSNGQVNFQIDVTDLDSDVANSSATSVSGVAYVDFGPNVGYDYGPVTIDGTPLLNKRSGTLTGSFIPPDLNGSVPSGTPVVFYIYISDSAGNQSNFVSIPGKY